MAPQQEDRRAIIGIVLMILGGLGLLALVIVMAVRLTELHGELRTAEGRVAHYRERLLSLKRLHDDARTDRHHRGIELSQCQSMTESLWVDLLTCRETPVVKLPGKL